MPLVVQRQRRRRDVVAAAPDLDLRFAVLRRGFRFVEPLQRPVMPFVEPPAPFDRQPQLIELSSAIHSVRIARFSTDV